MGRPRIPGNAGGGVNVTVGRGGGAGTASCTGSAGGAGAAGAGVGAGTDSAGGVAAGAVGGTDGGTASVIVPVDWNAAVVIPFPPDPAGNCGRWPRLG